MENVDRLHHSPSFDDFLSLLEMRSAYGRIHNSSAQDKHYRYKKAFNAFTSKIRAIIFPFKLNSLASRDSPPQMIPQSMCTSVLTLSTNKYPPPYTLEAGTMPVFQSPVKIISPVRETALDHWPSSHPQRAVAPQTPLSLSEVSSTSRSFPVRFPFDPSSSTLIDPASPSPRTHSTRKRSIRRNSSPRFALSSILPLGKGRVTYRSDVPVSSEQRTYTLRCAIDEPCTPEFLSLNARRRQRRMSAPLSQSNGFGTGACRSARRLSSSQTACINANPNSKSRAHEAHGVSQPCFRR